MSDLLQVLPSLTFVVSGLLYHAYSTLFVKKPKVDVQAPQAPDSETLIKQLIAYKEKTPVFSYVVGVDVGATNTRTAFFITDDKNNTTIFETKFQCKNMNHFRNYYIELGKKVVQVLGARSKASVLALAGPIKDNKVTITNYEVNATDLYVDELTETLFPKGKTRFINDLEAACFGIISLGLENRLGEYMASLWVPNEKSKSDTQLEPISYAVLSMGTGLGVGLISYNPLFGEYKYQPVPLEAGHCLIPAPGPNSPYYERDLARLQFLSNKLYGGKYGVEYEDICSGRGLQYCYEFELRQLPTYKEGDKLDIPESAEIAIRAGKVKNNETPESRALLVHYKYLMEAAQMLCVMVPAVKGVFFTGDNQLANEEFVVQSHNAKIYKEVFTNHPKSHWLVPITEKMVRQKVPFNFNLEGTKYVANQLK